MRTMAIMFREGTREADRLLEEHKGADNVDEHENLDLNLKV